MINLIQQLMHIHDPEQLMQMDISRCTDLSFGVYWKDLTGKYLGCNDYLARQGGFLEKSSVVGLTDFDLAWSNEAENYTSNDIRVVKTQKSSSFIETGTQSDRTLRSHFSYKMPLLTRALKPAGVIGISFMLEPDMQFNPLGNKLLSTDSSHPLSKQQMDCLFYLVLGMTMKEIAETMQLAPKTVEHYLDTVKQKLQCKSRSELVKKALSFSVIKNRLLNNIASER